MGYIIGSSESYMQPMGIPTLFKSQEHYKRKGVAVVSSTAIEMAWFPRPLIFMISEIGPHRVCDACVSSDEVDKMMAGVTARVFYSDPPWGDGNLKYWSTMNRKMTGRDFKPITYDVLLARLQDLIRKYVKGHVFLETGKNFVDQAVTDMKAVLFGINTFQIKYRSGSRFIINYLIHGITYNSPASPFDFDPSGMTGYLVPERCVFNVSLPGEVVFDPCCGMGYSARAAVNAGMRFYGNEFNRSRLGKTIGFLKSSLS